MGRLPPRHRPAATAMASPSRQTRTSCKPGWASRADSHVPNSLSGIHTTWVMPQAASVSATDEPSIIAYSLRAMGLVATDAGALQLLVDRLGGRFVLLVGGAQQRLGIF